MSNSSSKNSNNNGIGFAGLLAILFIGLKLGGVITWSWWWVLSPLWIGFAIFLGLASIAGLVFLGAVLLSGRGRKSTIRAGRRF